MGHLKRGLFFVRFGSRHPYRSRLSFQRIIRVILDLRAETKKKRGPRCLTHTCGDACRLDRDERNLASDACGGAQRSPLQPDGEPGELHGSLEGDHLALVHHHRRRHRLPCLERRRCGVGGRVGRDRGARRTPAKRVERKSSHADAHSVLPSRSQCTQAERLPTVVAGGAAFSCVSEGSSCKMPNEWTYARQPPFTAHQMAVPHQAEWRFPTLTRRQGTAGNGKPPKRQNAIRVSSR